MYNIYHLLNSSYGNTLKLKLILAMKSYEKRESYFCWFEGEAETCLSTLFDCKIISSKEYNVLIDQLFFLMRLYKGVRGSALGRKDVPNE